MPETTRSGRPLKTCVTATLTQSVGVPSTAKTRSSIVSSRSGRRSVSAWPIALASVDRRDDGDVAERSQRVGERMNALGSIAVVVGDQNANHVWTIIALRHSARQPQRATAPRSASERSSASRYGATAVLDDGDPDLVCAARCRDRPGSRDTRPIGSKRSGENGTAAPSLYQRAPLNSSQTPSVRATGAITDPRGRRRRGRPQSRRRRARGDRASAGRSERHASRPRGGGRSGGTMRRPRRAAARSDAISTGNDGVRLPVVPASSRSRGARRRACSTPHRHVDHAVRLERRVGVDRHALEHAGLRHHLAVEQTERARRVVDEPSTTIGSLVDLPLGSSGGHVGRRRRATGYT